MKAVTWQKYGPPEVLQLAEVNQPVPKKGELLVKIKATTVTAGDYEVRRFKVAPMFWVMARIFLGIFKPKLLSPGQELSGVVEAVGNNVSKFKVGDEIFAPSDLQLSTYAEYICLKEHQTIALKPKNCSFEEAAGVPTGGLNALYFLEKVKIKPGQKILIIGAGGSIGTFAIQLAKLKGAIVTAIDHSDKLALLTSLGADHVIDYTKDDFTKNNQSYDVIFDVVGFGLPLQKIKKLTPKGTYLLANPGFRAMFGSLLFNLISAKKFFTGLATYKQKEIDQLQTLMTQNKLHTPIDKILPLEQIVEAHHYVESGKKKGVLAIKV